MCFFSCCPFLCFSDCYGTSGETELKYAKACWGKIVFSYEDISDRLQVIHNHFKIAVALEAPQANEEFERFKTWQEERVTLIKKSVDDMFAERQRQWAREERLRNPKTIEDKLDRMNQTLEKINNAQYRF